MSDLYPTDEEIEEAERHERQRLVRKREGDMHAQQEAEMFLKNPLLINSLAVMEQTWMNLLRNGPVDTATRFEEYKLAAPIARMKLDCLDEIRRQLRSIVDTGKIAENQIAAEGAAAQAAAAEDQDRG